MGDSCSISKTGLLLSVGVDLKITVGNDGVAEEHSDLWLRWLSTAVADAVAQLTSITPGNVETNIICGDPRAADIAAFGGAAGASFECSAQVKIAQRTPVAYAPRPVVLARMSIECSPFCRCTAVFIGFAPRGPLLLRFACALCATLTRASSLTSWWFVCSARSTA